jgi:phosphohistidine phosphatase SixA
VTSILLRHARAGDRSEWDGDDRLRPLDARGLRQAAELVELLRPHGIGRIVSSPYVRCIQTVEPLAAALGLEVELDARLAEGAGRDAAALLAEDGVVACTHGDVVLDLLGRMLKKGAAAIVEPDGAGAFHGAETIAAPKGRRL